MCKVSAKLHSLKCVQQIAFGEHHRLYQGVNIIPFTKIICNLRWFTEATAKDIKYTSDMTQVLGQVL